VPLRSLQLGLIGKADVVEFHLLEEDKWRPYPVEHKRGKPKPDECDKVQLCAQALCLEEMLGVDVPAGALFYGRTRHRLDVEFDQALRDETLRTAARAHELIRSGKSPKPVYTKKCKSCSLMDQCLPQVLHKRRSVKGYLAQAQREE
jgi:CRISPR-associated exonuclease Cas4